MTSTVYNSNMRLKLIELEDDISNNYTSLKELNLQVDDFLEHISLILDFGMDNNTIEEFYNIHRESLNTIQKQISKRIK